jgi:hypothetical protein
MLLKAKHESQMLQSSKPISIGLERDCFCFLERRLFIF